LEVTRTTATQQLLRETFAARPDAPELQEPRGLELELSGAPDDAVRSAYDRALVLSPGNPHALMGLGRLELPRDPEAALAFFDRAAAATPSDSAPMLLSARALIASGNPNEAALRLDTLLVQHPLDLEAAMERARLDLDLGVATDQTLERARRAVLLGGGVESLELLSQVHEKRGEVEPAMRAAERARIVREAQAEEQVSVEVENTSLPRMGDIAPPQHDPTPTP
jgi:predicted Zn-dependent protease